MRFYLVLLAIVALWATFSYATPLAENAEALSQQVNNAAADALLNSDGQGHENVGERETRRHHGGGGYHHGVGHHHGGHHHGGHHYGGHHKHHGGGGRRGGY